MHAKETGRDITKTEISQLIKEIDIFRGNLVAVYNLAKPNPPRTLNFCGIKITIQKRKDDFSMEHNRDYDVNSFDSI